MLSDNEFWATVVNSSANWVVAAAIVIQTALFYITYKFGFRYLSNHREKVKEERRLELIKSTKEKITLFIITANRVYDIPQSLINKLDDPIWSTTSLIENFFKDFYSKNTSDKIRLEELAAEVTTNLILLIRNDLQIKWSESHLNTNGIDLFYAVKKDVIERSRDEQEKKRQFLMIPRSFTNGNHYLNSESRSLVKDFQDELTKMYHE